MLLRVVFTLSAIVHLAVAQDLSVPGSWRKPNNARPFHKRVRISQNAIEAIARQLNTGEAVYNGIGWWQTGSVMSAIANHDHFSGTTTYKNHVVNNINKAWQLHSNFDPNLWWATAAVNAYRAYGDPTMLSHAVNIWNHVSTYVIQPAGGSQKNFAVTKSCFGRSMVGGVFWRPTSDDQNVNSITTGLYMTLSAYLAEITHDPKYTKAAIAGAQWIERMNLNSNNIVLDSVNGNSCSRSPSSWLFTYNSGKFVEGLSILADVTGNPHWKQLMVTIVASATKSSAWQGSDGIITEGSDNSKNNDGIGFKAIFIRGLCEAFVRNLSNVRLGTLIHSYIDVQYNAVLDLAANRNTYSASWHGPRTEFTTWGQMSALDVVVSAIPANHYRLG